MQPGGLNRRFEHAHAAVSTHALNLHLCRRLHAHGGTILQFQCDVTILAGCHLRAFSERCPDRQNGRHTAARCRLHVTLHMRHRGCRGRGFQHGERNAFGHFHDVGRGEWTESVESEVTQRRVRPHIPAAQAAAPAAAVDEGAAEAAYREAFGLLRAADYGKAAAAFTAFQATYPNSQYGDSAQYWLAEALAADGKHDKAAAEYQKLMVQFPASKKLPYAMLKLGDSYDKLGKAKEAKAIWAELRKQFPASAAAKLAEQRPGVAAPAR